jgi:hypothetical protein
VFGFRPSAKYRAPHQQLKIATPLSRSIKTKKKFIVTENGKIKIYRTVLHYRLLDYLIEYKTALRSDTKDGELLRKYFARKLDDLFEFKADKNDWWSE